VDKPETIQLYQIRIKVNDEQVYAATRLPAMTFTQLVAAQLAQVIGAVGPEKWASAHRIEVEVVRTTTRMQKPVQTQKPVKVSENGDTRAEKVPLKKKGPKK